MGWDGSGNPGARRPASARLLEGVAMHSFASGDIDAGRRVAEQPPGCGLRPGLGSRLAASIHRGLADERAATSSWRPRPSTGRSTSPSADLRLGDEVSSYWRAAVAADQSNDQLARRLLEEPAGEQCGPTTLGDGRDAPSARAHCPAFGDPARALDLAASVRHPRGRRVESRDRCAHDAIGRALTPAVGRPKLSTNIAAACSGRSPSTPARRRQGLGGAGRGDRRRR